MDQSGQLTVTIYKAMPTGGRPAPDLVLEAREPIPSFKSEPASATEHWEDFWRARYEAQAQQILDALVASLPGGTVHALTIALLQHKTCLFGVTDLPADPWVTPADYCPEDSRQVLIYTARTTDAKFVDRQITMGHRYKGTWCWQDGRLVDPEICTVLAWRPLPRPPRIP